MLTTKSVSLIFKEPIKFLMYLIKHEFFIHRHKTLHTYGDLPCASLLQSSDPTLSLTEPRLPDHEGFSSLQVNPTVAMTEPGPRRLVRFCPIMPLCPHSDPFASTTEPRSAASSADLDASVSAAMIPPSSLLILDLSDLNLGLDYPLPVPCRVMINRPRFYMLAYPN